MTYQFTFRLLFLVLNFVDFDKKPSLSRKSVFHGYFYFVVYSRYPAPYTIRGRALSI